MNEGSEPDEAGEASTEHLGRSPSIETTQSSNGRSREAHHQDHGDGFAEQLLPAGPDHKLQLLEGGLQKTTFFPRLFRAWWGLRRCCGCVLGSGAGHG